ncbi:hypothetical protein [Longispora fulva]|uniref:Uncharacterized protein n=1 Tax=Longispora fulva TaxID=619741 RepID=A0A8J7GGK6_9ACTN|nr:hypothetical protein [Longispora fulva]MBG6135713.1 hypothetical protein [Longispora fulva]
MFSEVDDAGATVERASDDIDSDGVVDDVTGEPALDERHVLRFVSRHDES